MGYFEEDRAQQASDRADGGVWLLLILAVFGLALLFLVAPAGGVP